MSSLSNWPVATPVQCANMPSKVLTCSSGAELSSTLPADKCVHQHLPSVTFLSLALCEFALCFIEVHACILPLKRVAWLARLVPGQFPACCSGDASGQTTTSPHCPLVRSSGRQIALKVCTSVPLSSMQSRCFMSFSHALN